MLFLEVLLRHANVALEQQTNFIFLSMSVLFFGQYGYA